MTVKLRRKFSRSFILKKKKHFLSKTVKKIGIIGWKSAGITKFVSDLTRMPISFKARHAFTFLPNSEGFVRRCSIKVRVLKNFPSLTGKDLCLSLLLIKLKASHFSLKRLQHRCFPVKYAKYLRTHFFTEHLRWLPLNIFRILVQSLQSFGGEGIIPPLPPVSPLVSPASVWVKMKIKNKGKNEKVPKLKLNKIKFLRFKIFIKFCYQ